MAKLDIKDVMAAIDTDSKGVWDELTPEEQKEVVFFILNRWTSNVSGSRELKEHYLLLVNHRYNKNLFPLLTGKHHKLLWQLLCSCSHEKKQIQQHNWLAVKKAKNKKEEWLAEQFPTMKYSDIETLAVITTDAEIKEYAAGLGWDKKAISAIKL